MRFTSLLLACLMALSTTAAPLDPTPSLPAELTIGVSTPINRTHIAERDSSLAKRFDYCNIINEYDRQDGLNLKNWLQTNSGWTDLYPYNYWWASWGSAKVCVYNWQSSDTWLSNWEAGWGIGYLIDWCGQYDEFLFYIPKGSCTGHGSNNFEVQIVAQWSGENC